MVFLTVDSESANVRERRERDSQGLGNWDVGDRWSRGDVPSGAETNEV